MKKLSKNAYGGVAGKEYVPYEEGRKSNTGNLIVLIIGLVLAIVFAASTAYSGMKAGLTVAAGIPGAILGSGILSLFIRKNNFLKKNILQAMASGGESIASGIIFVLPAIILIGGKVNFFWGVLIGVAAVFFGIGIMAFVQDYLLVEEHGTLIYPESMAISETLVASDTGGSSLKFMGIGFGIGGLITTMTTQVFGWANNQISYVNESYYKWKFEMEVNPMLAAIGFIVGLDIAVWMFAGAVLANFAIAPLIAYFAAMASEGHVVWNAAEVQISSMQFADIAGSYVKYIGAGMMISGGIIGAIKLIPTIINSVKATLNGRKNAEAGEGADSTGIIALVAGLVLTLVFAFIISGNPGMAIVAALVSLFLSLLFVIVAGRLTGTIGTSNLPVSGMTIASLVILSLVFLVNGWTSNGDIQTLLFFGTFIVVAISIAGGYAQSQKVTFIVGGNPNELRRYYLIAGTVGVVVVIGVISLLSEQLAVAVNPQFALPQANLMATLTSGIIQGDLPWHMIIVGIVIGIVLQMLGMSIMTFAIGFYLPISTTSIILVGALLRVLVERLSQKETEEVQAERISSGVSLSSGLVAGASIIGLIGIILQVTDVIEERFPSGFLGTNTMGWIFFVILCLAMVLPLMSIKKVASGNDEA